MSERNASVWGYRLNEAPYCSLQLVKDKRADLRVFDGIDFGTGWKLLCFQAYSQNCKK
jgi:hypothetical protein